MNKRITQSLTVLGIKKNSNVVGLLYNNHRQRYRLKGACESRNVFQGAGTKAVNELFGGLNVCFFVAC